ncbi:uncharacterized protein [Triticum aestivum]|uniref:uncharacterized protein n=1 Tax=Triticum aestivum TaxID=4565 RepID=UPI001D0274DD|nr:uncharacterized protein LOC123077685 [Triticum aestivum]
MPSDDVPPWRHWRHALTTRDKDLLDTSSGPLFMLPRREELFGPTCFGLRSATENLLRPCCPTDLCRPAEVWWNENVHLNDSVVQVFFLAVVGLALAIQTQY